MIEAEKLEEATELYRLWRELDVSLKRTMEVSALPDCRVSVVLPAMHGVGLSVKSSKYVLEILKADLVERRQDCRDQLREMGVRV